MYTASVLSVISLLALINEEMQISLSWEWNSPRADFVEQDCGFFLCQFR